MEAALEDSAHALQRSPFAMGVIKELAAGTRDLSLSEGMRHGHRASSVALAAPTAGCRVPGEAQAGVHGQVKAAVLHEIGQPLSVEDITDPEAGEGQSVVDVKAAGINFADVLIRNGQYPQPPPLPVILGNEVAGDVDGRRVLAFVRGSGGGHASKPWSTTSGSSTYPTRPATRKARRF